MTEEKSSAVIDKKMDAQKDENVKVTVKKVPPKRIKEFDVEKLKPFFIQFEEPVHEITELEVCKNILVFIVAVVGLSLVFLFGIFCSLYLL